MGGGVRNLKLLDGVNVLDRVWLAVITIGTLVVRSWAADTA